jgi:hypothetical protein
MTPLTRRSHLLAPPFPTRGEGLDVRPLRGVRRNAPHPDGAYGGIGPPHKGEV